ncbi:MAG: mannose-1-phosphate guanylyltransferase/mannose-6-phosphate isomerase [Bdellovibrionaceae bacterium]|nr:mannose-1-phosphate guanylyltransferase/mannose-6-phosphate isomerase [Pseudobdellovibrionaceae bacterium]
MIPVVMSGGSGTRLWPVSRAHLPKQFCDLLGEPLQSLTLKRVAPFGAPWIITSSALRTLTEINAKSTGLAMGRVLYEPTARNTAAAIGLLCRCLQLQGLGHEVAGVFPSDHLVRREKEFRAAVDFAGSLAEEGKVVTLGIKPDRPETGFGYIQTSGEATRSSGHFQAKPVQAFHEKPSLEKARSFLQQGSFSWNAGIFIFRADVMARLLETYEPAVWQPLSELREDLSNLEEVYARVKSISIDYAVMEKIGGGGELVCVPADIGWSDVGSWDAVAEENRLRGVESRGAVVKGVDSRGVFVEAPAGKTVALIGVEDLNVVDTGDALLIARKGESQRVREIVDPLTKAGDAIVKDHAFEDRPWGRFEILRDTDHFKSKVITVHAKQQISYQSHARREEHWTITRGVGEVVLNDQVIPVRAGSHVHIPLGAKHRIRNTSDQPLEFVEVQLGDYFGEDDIVRYQDDYKRV